MSKIKQTNATGHSQQRSAGVSTVAPLSCVYVCHVVFKVMQFLLPFSTRTSNLADLCPVFMSGRSPAVLLGLLGHAGSSGERQLADWERKGSVAHSHSE